MIHVKSNHKPICIIATPQKKDRKGSIVHCLGNSVRSSNRCRACAAGSVRAATLEKASAGKPCGRGTGHRKR